MITLKRRLFLTIVLILVSGPICPLQKLTLAQAQEIKPAAALIAEKALIKSKESHNIKKQHSFRRIENKESLNESGAVVNTAVKTEVKLGKDFKMAGQNLDFYEILSTRFDFFWDESETTAIVNGTQCLVIHLRPKPNLQVKNSIDQLANKLLPVLYIELDSLSIQRITARIPAQFSFWHFLGGFIPIRVTISIFNVDMDMQRINDLLWAENKIVVTAKYSIAGASSYERYTYTHDQFKR